MTDPKNCFTHCSAFCTFCTWVVEIRDLLFCSSSIFSMTSVAEWNAILSSSERLFMYSWIAFWNASFFTGIEIAGDWGFWDWSLASGAVAEVLLKADPAVVLGLGLGLGLVDRWRRKGPFRNLPYFRTPSLFFPEDILCKGEREARTELWGY